MNFEQAERKAVRPLIALAGPSSSGKTLSALLLARGLVGPQGKIILLDTESARSRIYADDTRIGGFLIGEMHPPYTSESFSKGLDDAEKAGAAAIVVDSFSQEWSGIGGCVEQAENSKRPSPSNWILPKSAHRRMVNRILQTQVPIIFCLRTKPEFLTTKDEKGKQTFSKGPEIAEQESRFIYEMTIGALLNYQTHQAFYSQLKNLPDPLLSVLSDGNLITVETGEAIRDWINGGTEVDPEYERQASILRDLASSGTEALVKHWGTLDGEWRRKLVNVKEDCKAIAVEGDRLNKAALDGEPEQPAPTGDPFEDASTKESHNYVEDCLKHMKSIGDRNELHEWWLDQTDNRERLGITDDSDMGKELIETMQMRLKQLDPTSGDT